MILVDGRYLSGGIGHYVRGLIPLIQSDLDVRFFGSPEGLQEAGVLSSHIIPYPPKHFSPRFLALGGFDSALQEAELIHFVHFDVPLYTRVPYVVTIQDLFPPGRGVFRAKRLLAHFLIRRAALNAAVVVNTSHTVREQLYRMTGRRAAVIKIYHNPIDHNQTLGRSEDLPERTRVLWIGSHKLHKGLPEALAAFRLLRKSVPDASMALLGIAPSRAGKIRRQLIRLGLEGAVEVLQLLDEDAKLELVQTSDLVLHTSCHEGFGLVPGEGLLTGTPVLARDLPVLREIYGDAIHYYSGNISSLSAEMKKVLGSRPTATPGAWSPQSLEAFAEEHYAVYKESLRSFG